ncbi:type VI secretion system-associated FHA domain protein TagH [Paraburkholderia sp. RL18-103-BIB-C]|uniref:type VI secretion system-associated FHA domain protein TagH n=1 Tax=unclassified Paraburkholderia TaxID=2615204 RepID=UPI0038BC1940
MSTSRLSMEVSGGSAGTHRVEFDGHDATLGRAPDCTLVLSDDQRLISRVQARIEWRGGDYVLVDLGSNPTLVNGCVLDVSREATLRSGDTLRIGGYSIVVAIEPPADAFPAHDTPGETPAEAWSVSPQAGVRHETAQDAPLIPALIPTHWDVDPKVAPEAKTPQAPDSPFLDDPLSATPLLLAQPVRDGEADQDLLAALSVGLQPLGMSLDTAARPVMGSGPDHVSPERVVSVLPLPMPPRPLIPRDYDALAAATMPDDAQVRARPTATDAGPAALEPAAVPEARTEMPTPTPARPEPPLVKIEQAQDTSPEASTQTFPTATTTDAVFTALLDGLGLDALQFTQHSKPALARVIGSMLREATHGTMTALRSRSVAKHESRIAMTLIEQRDNNPLKFFPDADTALTQMLVRPNAAYLGPQAAMREAFRDLQGHELAVVAGMRAALADALANIAPERIEGSLRPASRVESLIANHEARLWRQFVETYEHAVKHAGDDFQQTCGGPFSRAYQAQMAAMSQPDDEQ